MKNKSNYKVIIKYKSICERELETNIDNKDMAITYAIDCLIDDLLYDENYRLNLNNDIISINTIDTSNE